LIAGAAAALQAAGAVETVLVLVGEDLGAARVRPGRGDARRAAAAAGALVDVAYLAPWGSEGEVLAVRDQNVSEVVAAGTPAEPMAFTKMTISATVIVPSVSQSPSH
jgi:hypothetical protein